MNEVPASPSLDVHVTIEVDPAALTWPAPGAARDETGLGMNRQYCDLRGMGWRTVKGILAVEGELIREVMAAPDPVLAMVELGARIEEELDEGGDHPLFGLDLGVASATLSLSAVGCVTFASCNGGGFGEGRHLESYPLIAFYMRSRVAAIIAECAALANVGLAMHNDGSLQVYADRATDLYAFAKQVYNRRSRIRQANKSALDGRHRRRLSTGSCAQLDLLKES